MLVQMSILSNSVFVVYALILIRGSALQNEVLVPFLSTEIDFRYLNFFWSSSKTQI